MRPVQINDRAFVSAAPIFWQFATSYLEYLSQLPALLRDPIYRGPQVPQGHGEPVLLIPGFFAGDWTLLVMARWLSRIGYRPYLSGIDWNVGCPKRTEELLGWRLAHITEETGSPVVVVGHSLGGLLARALGAHFPASVCHVVALGSPLHDSLRATHPLVRSIFHTLHALFGAMGDSSTECGNLQCPSELIQNISSPLPQGVGSTAIFSKQDEVVDWRACLTLQGDNREVSGRHVSLVVNREVYRILAETLIPYSHRQEGQQDSIGTAGGKECLPTLRVAA